MGYDQGTIFAQVRQSTWHLPHFHPISSLRVVDNVCLCVTQWSAYYLADLTMVIRVVSSGEQKATSSSDVIRVASTIMPMPRVHGVSLASIFTIHCSDFWQLQRNNWTLSSESRGSKEDGDGKMIITLVDLLRLIDWPDFDQVESIPVQMKFFFLQTFVGMFWL